VTTGRRSSRMGAGAIWPSADHAIVAGSDPLRTLAICLLPSPLQPHLISFCSTTFYCARVMAAMCSGLGRILSVVLIGFLMAASGAPCTATPLSSVPVASPFDPCGHVQVPPSNCAQINCKNFAFLSGSFPRPLAANAPVRFCAPAKEGADRLIRPPLPPPRNPTI